MECVELAPAFDATPAKKRQQAGCTLPRGGTSRGSVAAARGYDHRLSAVNLRFGISSALPLCDTRAHSRVASLTCRVQTGFIKTSVDLDEELASQVREIASLTREKPATILRTAIRAGLPIVKNRLHDERSKGYFAEAYRHWTDERLKFEARMAKATVQKPER